MYKIICSNAKVALIDDEDLIKVSKYRWHCFNTGYVNAWKWNKELKKCFLISIARLVMDAPKGKEIDHIDRNKLNNQKSNLRFVDRATNVHNTGLSKNNSSGFKGVYFNKIKNKFKAYIMVNKKQCYLGWFNQLNEAIKARQLAEKKYWNI